MTLATEDRDILESIVRDALAAALKGESYRPNDPPAGRGALQAKGGCFVTLKTGGRLRGCIGCFESAQPIYKTVAEYTRHSALDDPRFTANRLTADELSGVDIDISILSPLARCDDPTAITPGVHGIYVRKGMQSGCFLPQVAEETGWSLEEFWGHCCRDKAGLSWNAWLEPGVELLTFTAEIITLPPAQSMPPKRP